jgi:toxin ParE1/3/4
MSFYQLKISPLALDDLRNIFHYGINSWGKVEAASYLEKLKEQLWGLTEYPDIGRSRNDILPLILCLVIEKHIIFYQIKVQKIFIVRILHGKQDPQIHIK